MTKLIVNSNTGYGKCTNEDGTFFSVLKANNLWNLNVQRKGEFAFWAKENVKRIGTLQKFADQHGYNIEIELI